MTDGTGVERRLDDRQVLQFQWQAIHVKCLFEDGHVEIAGAKHIRDRAAQVTAILVDKLLHHIVICQFHHSRDATQAVDVDFLFKDRIDIRVLAIRVGNEIFACIPLPQKAVGVVGHPFGEVYGLFLLVGGIDCRYLRLCPGSQHSGDEHAYH